LAYGRWRAVGAALDPHARSPTAGLTIGEHHRRRACPPNDAARAGRGTHRRVIPESPGEAAETSGEKGWG
jgi:hypothetical protein